MLHRTYIVRMPLDNDALDIMVEGPVGFTSSGAVAAPGTQPTVAVQLANAPAGWLGNGAFYEVRSRPLRLPQRALLPSGSANPAFVPRFALGWTLSIISLNTAVFSLPPTQLSASLIGANGLAITGLAPALLADPTYGPVIRLHGGSGETPVGGVIFAVHLQVATERDEDRTTGG